MGKRIFIKIKVAKKSDVAGSIECNKKIILLSGLSNPTIKKNKKEDFFTIY